MGDMEIIRTDIVQGGNEAPQNMIRALKEADSFQSNKISGIGDDTELAVMAQRISADRAKLLIGKGKATGTKSDFFLQFNQGLG